VDLLLGGEGVEHEDWDRDLHRLREVRPGPALALEALFELRPQRLAEVEPEGAADRAAAVIPGLEGVLAQILLRHHLEPLRPRGPREQPAGDLKRLVHRRPVLRREADAKSHPPVLRLRAAAGRLHAGLEGANRLVPRALDPARLGLAHRDRQHRLRVPEPDLAGEEGRAQERPRPQLAGELDQGLRGPLAEVEDLARVIAHAREPEGDEPIALAEREEPLADGEVERALHARDLREHAFAGVGLVLPGADEGEEFSRSHGLERERRRRESRRQHGRATSLYELQPRAHAGRSSHERLTLNERTV